MLELTQEAVDVIRGIAESEEEAADETGLRITTEEHDDATELNLAFVEGPEQGDETVEHEGARVYLDDAASSLLSDKVLDAHEHDDHVHFSIGRQGEELPPHEH